MYFSKTLVASVLLGLGAATTNMGTGAAGGLATSSTSAGTAAIAASETKGSSGAKATGGAAAASGAAASGAASAGGMVATHVIQVGGANGSLTFSPENIKAAVGDLVQFQFHPKNHSVVQSTFDQPCTPIQNVMPNMTTAFFSGFMPTNASVGATSQVLTYTIRVMDTKPVWFYCSQAKHCQGGMVGAINAAESGNKTMAAFRALAATMPENLSPGQKAGSGTGAAGAGTGSNGTGTGSGSAAAPSAPSGGAGTGAGAGSTTSGGAPAQQTTSAALRTSSSQSLFGLVLGAVAAMLLL